MNYKFLNSADVDRVLVDGTMMVSSLDHFRRLERGDIGDPLEGGSSLTVRDQLTATEGSTELAALNAANIGLGAFGQLAKIENGGMINISAGASFVHYVPNLYIYSFAAGDLASLTEAICDEAPEPYDACLTIQDPTVLAHYCFNYGVIRNLRDKLVSELFENVLIGDVEYVARTVDITEGAALAPDPFKKEPRFNYQSERRLVFVLRQGQVAPDRFVFAITEQTKHFDLVFKQRPRK